MEAKMDNVNFNQLLLAAFLVESLIQTLKPIYDKEKGWNKDAIIALVVSILICVLIKIDLFATVGLPIEIGNTTVGTYIGAVLTGVIASRGSNLAHDILKFIENKAGASVSSRGNPVG